MGVQPAAMEAKQRKRFIAVQEPEISREWEATANRVVAATALMVDHKAIVRFLRLLFG